MYHDIYIYNIIWYILSLWSLYHTYIYIYIQNTSGMRCKILDHTDLLVFSLDDFFGGVLEHIPCCLRFWWCNQMVKTWIPESQALPELLNSFQASQVMISDTISIKKSLHFFQGARTRNPGLTQRWLQQGIRCKILQGWAGARPLPTGAGGVRRGLDLTPIFT